MNEQILSQLIGMLAGGASAQQILSHFRGASGSAYYDGLQALIAQRNYNFQKKNKLDYSNGLISRHVDSFIDTLGFNPVSAESQGVASIISQLYRFAPDTIGAIIGLPNKQSFYQQIANGASGISVASGRGQVAMFNPYSAQSAYNHAVSLANSVAGMASIGGKGFNIGFTHGLNMNEVGMVTSRLLSSRIPYEQYGKDEFGNIDYRNVTGNTLDTTSKEFSEQLKNLGEKFNAAASMLTKITGSVKESLRLMDELSGGNFLGGSAQDALDTARRAQNMAANIRITSAMAGVSPQESYQNMRSTQQGLLLRSGVDPRLASYSGYGGMLMRQAGNDIISYNMWLASNPGASEVDRERVLLAIQHRSTQYVGTNGEAAAAIVSAHMNLFSPDELSEIKEAYRRGEPDSVRKLIQSRIGIQAYNDYINDPAAIQAFKDNGDRKFQEDMFEAATEGNNNLTQLAGRRRTLSNNLSRTDAELERVTGDRRYRSKDRRSAVEEALRRLAVENGLTEDGAKNMNVTQLRRYLNESGVDSRIVERTEHTAEIERQERDIRNNTMNSNEEAAARERLSRFVDTLSISEEEKNKIKSQIANGGNINQIYDQQVRRLGLDYDTKILGGKLSRAESERMLSGLKGDKDFWSVDVTNDEMMRSVKSRLDAASLFATVNLTGTIVGKEFRGSKTDKEALEKYSEQVRAFIDSGNIELSKGQTAEQLMDETRKKAFTDIIANVLGGKIGKVGENDEKVDGKNNEYENAVARISKKVQAGVADGKSMSESFSEAIDELINDKEFVAKIGEDGLKRLQQLKDDENREVRNGINRETVAGKETELYNKMMSQKIGDIYKGLLGAKTSEEFIKYAEQLAASGIINKEDLQGIDRSNLNTENGRKEALRRLTPDALGARADVMAAQLGVTPGDVNASIMAGIVARAKKDGLSQENTIKILEKYGQEHGLSEEQIRNVVSGLDDSNAEKTANALSEALNFSKGSLSQKEIERGKKIIEDLRSFIGKGVSAETIDALASDDEKERNKAKDRLRQQIAKTGKYSTKEESEYAVKYISEIAQGDYDGKSGADKLKDTKETFSNENLLEAAKGAYNKDDAAYDTLKFVSKILENLVEVRQLMNALVH